MTAATFTQATSPVAPIVTMIPARPRVGSAVRKEAVPKLRVAAYSRVSTDSDEQATSYDAQIEHYTEFIQKNPACTLAGIFADDGISGCNTKKRDEFNRMIEECMAGKIDMVVTKSISRFARNTLDCLKYIRQLKDINIPIYFEKENINTMDPSSDVILTIMASLAQQESQSLSQNVKLGIQYRYQQGKVQVCTNRFLGYDKDKDGNLVINPEEAKVVKRIYREFLDGSTLYDIGKGLSADGIKTAAGSDYWLASTLKKILQNEKYIGDALLQKTVTTDFLTKKRVQNKGIAPQYYVTGSHEAIIPRNLYMRVQEEMARRARISTDTGKKRVYSGKYALSSIVFCGHCGDIYRRIKWNNHGCKSTVWRCVSRVLKGSSGVDCTARTVNENLLHEVVVRAINEALAEKDDFLPEIKASVEMVLKEDGHQEIAELDSQIEDLQKKLLEETRHGKTGEEIFDQIDALRDAKQKILLKNANNEGLKLRIEDLENFLNEQDGEVTEYDDTLIHRLIEKITVFDDKFVVEFKSGLETEIEG